jgi:teichuronic acid biosynthesis glycosyltransferase TuaH
MDQETTPASGLSDKTLLFLSLPRHDARYTSTPWQLAVEMAKKNTVIFTDHPFTFLDLVTKFKDQSIRKRIKAYFGADSIIKEGVHVVLAPFVWPINFLPKGRLYNFFSACNQRMVAKRINSFLRKNEIQSLLYINSFNFYFPEIPKRLSASVALNIYHCIDPMIKAFTLKHGVYLQEKASKEADIVVSTAPSLRDNFIKKGIEKSYLVPNAANFKLFSTPGNEVPARLSAIKGKTIGYLGNIERRTDFILLENTMATLQDWELIMAGPVEKEYVPESILKHPRIHFTGPFSHTEAPAVVKKFDVAIIPFKCDEVSNGIYPLKLFEYLAAGKPVVTTNFNPEILEGLKDVVHVAKDQSFAEGVLMEYATDSDEKTRKRVEVASAHTWEDRANQFGKLITTELRNKKVDTQPVTIMPSSNSGSLKEKIKSNPKLKKFILSLIFRKKPHGARVMWYIWLWLIFPRYFNRGISWASRLDLSPFTKFKIGKYSRIEQGVVINNGMGDVIIHDEVHTGIGCIIIGPVEMHKHVGLSQYVRVLGMHHGSDADSPHHYQRAWKAPVILEEDAFIGTGTVIMGKKNGEPLVLGRYCRVGANSVVTTDIPPYSVAVGNPAKVVRVWDFEKRGWVKPEAAKKVTTPEKAQEKLIPNNPTIFPSTEAA